MQDKDQRRTLYLRNLIIYDGSGNMPIRGDVLVHDGTIAMVGKITSSDIPTERLELSFDGLCVAPGFIDIHSHLDEGIASHPDAEILLKQGITTSIGGNCGSSAGDDPVLIQKCVDNYCSEVIRWKTFDSFLQALEKIRPAINIGMLFGHGDVRTQLVGDSSRALTSEELEMMYEISVDRMKSGAFGVSSGLEYVPGRFADMKELVTISRSVSARNGIHAMHLRNEGPELVESVAEAIHVACQTKVRFEVSHLKAVGEQNWGKLPEVLLNLEHCRRTGVDISADVYPYLASNTELAIVLPDWVLENGKQYALETLANETQVYENAAAESNLRTEKQGGWDKIVVISVINPEDKWMEGLSITEIATRLAKQPQYAALDILVDNRMEVGIVRHSMNEKDLIAAMQDPQTCIVTDGNLKCPSEGKIHPRSIGTYPRFLGYYVRDRGVMTLEEGVRRITSLPASKMGISNRGFIRPGLAADLVVFDPASIADRSTYENPWVFPTGIVAVFVNGSLAVSDGKLTGTRTGHVLRKTQQDQTLRYD